MTAAEQRQIDVHSAQMYASLGRLLRSLTAPLRDARQSRGGHTVERASSVCTQ